VAVGGGPPDRASFVLDHIISPPLNQSMASSLIHGSPIGKVAILLLACAGARGVLLQPGLDYGEERGKVWVRGPWGVIASATDVDEVVDQLCPAVAQLDRARNGDDGVEYCGLIYFLLPSRRSILRELPVATRPPQVRQTWPKEVLSYSVGSARRAWGARDIGRLP